MTRQARTVFALLVAATFGAFFVAQRLKHAPTVIQDFRGRRLFSPNGDGRRDRLQISFQLKSSDDISLDVIDADGDPLRSLIADRHVAAHRTIRAMWDGREDDGRRAPDGVYQLRLTLRDEGRTVLVRRHFRLDTTAPVPTIATMQPSGGAGPVLLPNGAGGVRITVGAPGLEPAVTIFRTSGAEPQFVASLPVTDRVATWDGKVAGRPVVHGSYVAVAQWRDRAGNLGSSVPVDSRTSAPALRYGAPLGGRGGITVRYLEVQPPSEPVRAGASIPVGVDARGARYRWTLRRLGDPHPIRRGATSRTPLRVRAPGGTSGIYIFEARAGGRTATVPLAVQGAKQQPVLVVLPFMTWQGRNAVDDDADGSPNMLDHGLPARLNRVFAGGALPEGFTEQAGPLLAYLSHNHRAFDVTTDAALAAGRGPKLAGHHGVLLPGDTRWLPRSLLTALRGFVRDGGTLVLDGTDSLRREVSVGSDGTMSKPTPAADTNLFGTKLRTVVQKPTTITNLTDTLQLFSGEVFGGTGVFSGFPGYEATASLGPSEKLAANAVTADGQSVLVAARFGKGLEIRTGLLDFATRLNADRNSGELLLRIYTLLSA